MTSRHSFPIQPDRPITTSADDRYGFGLTVVPRLLDVTIRAPGDEGIVVGLIGRWGSGKTSVLHLLREELQEADHHVIPVSPWFYDDPRALTLGFFGHLRHRLSGESGLDGVGDAFGALGEAVGIAGSSVAPWRPDLGLAAGLGAQVFNGVSRLMNRFGRASADLNEAWERVERALRMATSGTRRVVVLMDDVDRLSYVELTTLFRLVRTVGDLPGMSLVLAVDEAHVRRLLREGSPDLFGAEYLDKIIQAKVHVPPPLPARAREVLVANLEAVFSHANVPYPRQLRAHAFVVPRELRLLEGMLSSPRDVVRFSNALAVLLRDDGGQLDLSDAAILCAIDATMPEAFQALREHRETFLSERGPSMFGDRRVREDRRKQDYAALLPTLQLGGRRRLFEEAVALLFGLVSTDAGEIRAPHAGEGTGRRRLDSRRHFDTYFAARSPTLLSIGETEEVLAWVVRGDGSEPSPELADRVRALDEDGVAQFIEDLRGDLVRNENEIDAGGILRRVAPLDPDGRLRTTGLAAVIVEMAPRAAVNSWRTFWSELEAVDGPADAWPEFMRWALKERGDGAPDVWREVGREWLDRQLVILDDDRTRDLPDPAPQWLAELRMLGQLLGGRGAEIAHTQGRRVQEQPEWLPQLLESVAVISGEQVALSGRIQGPRSALGHVLSLFDGNRDALRKAIVGWRRVTGAVSDPHGLVSECEELLAMFPESGEGGHG